jgi:chaperone LolA
MRYVVPFLIALFVLTAPAPASAMTAEELAARLQGSYDRTTDLKAEFTQVSFVKAVRLTREGSGTLVIKKPGQLRYSYARPDKQEIIVRGQELVMYLPESKQVIKRHLDRALLDKTPSTFLAGLGRITDSFSVRFPKAGAYDGSGNHTLELVPKGEAMGIESITLTLEPGTYNILAFSFTETGGNTNTIRLKGVKRNLGVHDSAFEFTVPKGVKVIAE